MNRLFDMLSNQPDLLASADLDSRPGISLADLNFQLESLEGQEPLFAQQQFFGPPFAGLIREAYVPIMPVEHWRATFDQVKKAGTPPIEVDEWFDFLDIGIGVGAFLPDDRSNVPRVSLASTMSGQPVWLSLIAGSRLGQGSVSISANACEPHPNDPKQCIQRWCPVGCRKTLVLNRHNQPVPMCDCPL